MSRYRVRVDLPDLPGALAKVGTVISALDGGVVSIDIHEPHEHLGLRWVIPPSTRGCSGQGR
jgi:ACT domain-containing protein